MSESAPVDRPQPVGGAEAGGETRPMNVARQKGGKLGSRAIGMRSRRTQRRKVAGGF